MEFRGPSAIVKRKKFLVWVRFGPALYVPGCAEGVGDRVSDASGAVKRSNIVGSTHVKHEIASTFKDLSSHVLGRAGRASLPHEKGILVFSAGPFLPNPTFGQACGTKNVFRFAIGSSGGTFFDANCALECVSQHPCPSTNLLGPSAIVKPEKILVWVPFRLFVVYVPGCRDRVFDTSEAMKQSNIVVSRQVKHEFASTFKDL